MKTAFIFCLGMSVMRFAYLYLPDYVPFISLPASLFLIFCWMRLLVKGKIDV